MIKMEQTGDVEETKKVSKKRARLKWSVHYAIDTSQNTSSSFNVQTINRYPQYPPYTSPYQVGDYNFSSYATAVAIPTIVYLSFNDLRHPAHQGQYGCASCSRVRGHSLRIALRAFTDIYVSRLTEEILHESIDARTEVLAALRELGPPDLVQLIKQAPRHPGKQVH